MCRSASVFYKARLINVLLGKGIRATAQFSNGTPNDEVVRCSVLRPVAIVELG